MTLDSSCHLAHEQEEAEGGLGWVWMLTLHAAAFHGAKPSFLSLRPFSCIPFVLPQGRTEELEESSHCTLPTAPLEGLHSPLGSSLPNAGGHRWRRTTSVLDVSQAWSKFALLVHPALSREFFPGFLSL